MKIALTFPTRERATKVDRLITSFLYKYNTDIFNITLWLGVESSDPQLADYISLVAKYKNNLQINLVFLKQWAGLGAAFNTICDEALTQDPTIDIVTMFGDDMVFTNADQTFTAVGQFFNSLSNDKLGVISFNCGTGRPNQIAINGFIHRNWIKCFGYMIPSEFYGDYSDNWLTDISSQLGHFHYVSDITIQHLHGAIFTEETDNRVFLKNMYDSKQATSSQLVYLAQVQKYPLLLKKAQVFKEEMNRKIISFTLWGNNPKYTVGALENSKLQPIHFPDWTCRYYVDVSSVPPDIIKQLADTGSQIRTVAHGNWNNMFLRFLAAEDSPVMISRDCDSRLSARDFSAVSEWLESDKAFHIIRDHPAHGASILGGMWGARYGILKNIRHMIADFLHRRGMESNYYQIDQQFLYECVFPLVQPYSFVHDSFICNFGDKEHHRIKMERIDGDHIGSIFNEKNERQTSVK